MAFPVACCALFISFSINLKNIYKLASSKPPFCLCMYGAGNNCLLVARRGYIAFIYSHVTTNQPCIGVSAGHITKSLRVADLGVTLGMSSDEI